MEARWIQHLRTVARKQKESFVGGKIVDHRMLLERRDGQVIDAGPIKVKPQGSVVIAGEVEYNEDYPPGFYEPDIYVTKDGGLWVPATTESRFTGGPEYNIDAWTWTGDRFLLPTYQFDPVNAPLVQSRDGGTWSFHPDNVTFNNATNGYIHAMDSVENGLVIVVGAHFGEDEEGQYAISRDFGDTWEVPDTSLLPFSEALLTGVCLKNEFEWCFTDGFDVWYTYDGGGRWATVVYPRQEDPDYVGMQLSTYTSGIRWFNGYWWFYGNGQGTDEWDTPLIKSVDLETWIPIITPWSGTYPPAIVVNQGSYTVGPPPVLAYPDPPYHEGNSGHIENLRYDPSSNSVLARGDCQYNSSLVLMSQDGGERWFEIGYKSDAEEMAEDNWDGLYYWPEGHDIFDNPVTWWDVATYGGIAYGYGWWFINSDWHPDVYTPSMLRISVNGRITEPATPPHATNYSARMLLSGGDVNF